MKTGSEQGCAGAICNSCSRAKTSSSILFCGASASGLSNGVAAKALPAAKINNVSHRRLHAAKIPAHDFIARPDEHANSKASKKTNPILPRRMTKYD
jgi:hypothetical protein